MPKPTAAVLTKQVEELTAAAAEKDERIAELEASVLEETPASPPSNVIEAILAVMRDVRAVGKDGINQQQGFNFRGIDGTVNALGPAMRKHGLVVIPSVNSVHRERVATKSGGSGNSVGVEVTYTFYGPGGLDDTVQAVVPGESFDSGDKGTAKAMSVAFRTCLLQSFALPTQERDPDADSHDLVTPPTADEVLNAVEEAIAAAAQDGSDPVAALEAVWNDFTEPRLDACTITIDGRSITASRYINERAAAAARAPKPAPKELVDALRKAQALTDDTDAMLEALRALYTSFPKGTLPNTYIEIDGEQVIVDDLVKRTVEEIQKREQAAAAEDARTGAAPVEETRAPEATRAEEPARAQEPVSEGAARAQQQTVRDVRADEDPVFVPLRSEIQGQAAALGVQVPEYIAPLLAVSRGAEKVSDLMVPIVQQWVADQRPRVVEALRAAGRAREASTYAQQAPMTINMWEQLTGGGDAAVEQDAREPQTQG